MFVYLVLIMEGFDTGTNANLYEELQHAYAGPLVNVAWRVYQDDFILQFCLCIGGLTDGDQWIGVLNSKHFESLMEFVGGSITKTRCRSTDALVQSTNQDFFQCHQYGIEDTPICFSHQSQFCTSKYSPYISTVTRDRPSVCAFFLVPKAEVVFLVTVFEHTYDIQISSLDSFEIIFCGPVHEQSPSIYTEKFLI